MNLDFQFWKLTAGVICTVGLYSVLYRENRFYRFIEHMFLGLAAGFSVTALWAETLKANWWDKMVGRTAEGTNPAVPGYWLYIFLLPIGLMGYMVFSRKHNWMSKIPIGIILGLWSGQQVQIWWNRWGPQLFASMKPVIPTTFDSLTRPAILADTPDDVKAQISSNLYLSQAISNFVFVATILCVLSYFFFSFEIKNKMLKNMNVAGRWLLMVGFGAIFGSTVMARFSLFIDRMFFVWVEWFKGALLGMQ